MLFGLASAAVAALILVPVGGADRAPTIASLRADDAQVEAESRSAVLVLYSLESRLSAARDRLAVLEARTHRLKAERAVIDGELALARVDRRLALDHVASRLRYLYDYGTTTNSLDVVLGSTSLEQALTRLDDVNEVDAANQSIILQLHTAKTRFTVLSAELAARERALAQTTSAAADAVAQLGQLQAQQSAYIGGLQAHQAYDEREIAQLIAEAQAAEARALLLARQRAAAEAAAPVQVVVQPTTNTPFVVASPEERAPAAGSAGTSVATAPAPGGGESITVVATGYDLQGTTSTGLPVGFGVVAVDPSVIPLGSHLSIPGYGAGVAADTGGAIVGDRIDLWFPTQAQALDWGVRTVTITVDG